MRIRESRRDLNLHMSALYESRKKLVELPYLPGAAEVLQLCTAAELQSDTDTSAAGGCCSVPASFPLRWLSPVIVLRHRISILPVDEPFCKILCNLSPMRETPTNQFNLHMSATTTRCVAGKCSTSMCSHVACSLQPNPLYNLSSRQTPPLMATRLKGEQVVCRTA